MLTWPEPVSGAALVGAGDDGPGHGYRFQFYRARLLQLVEHPELRKPAALCEGASHVRSRVMMA